MSPQFIRISCTFSIKVIVRFEYGEEVALAGAGSVDDPAEKPLMIFFHALCPQRLV
jgi:hypothetical protein